MKGMEALIAFLPTHRRRALIQKPKYILREEISAPVGFLMLAITWKCEVPHSIQKIGDGDWNNADLEGQILNRNNAFYGHRVLINEPNCDPRDAFLDLSHGSRQDAFTGQLRKMDDTLYIPINRTGHGIPEKDLGEGFNMRQMKDGLFAQLFKTLSGDARRVSCTIHEKKWLGGPFKKPQEFALITISAKIHENPEVYPREIAY